MFLLEFAAVTHPVFSNGALEVIGHSMIDEMLVADTIPLRGEVPQNIHIISVGALLGEAIRRIQQGESISPLFDDTCKLQFHDIAQWVDP